MAMYNSQDPVGTSVTFPSIAVTFHSVAVTNAELRSRKILLRCRSHFWPSENLPCQTLVTFLQCNEIKAARVLPSGRGSLSLPLRSRIHTHTHMFPKHNVQCQTTVNSYIVAAKFKDAQEGQLSSILHSVRASKERREERRKKEGRGNKVTYTFHVPCLLAGVLLYWSPVEGFSLESFREMM